MTADTPALTDPMPKGSRLWSIYSRVYDGLLDFWPYVHLLELMHAEAAIASGDRVLDLGCGTGNLLRRILDGADCDVVGVDITAAMLGAATKKLEDSIDAGRAELVQDDVLAFLKRQPAASFDKILSTNVLYIIADQKSLWSELLRVLKPDGRIVVTTSVRTGSGPIIREHFSHSSIWKLLRPRLLAVFACDIAINLRGKSGTYAFSNEATLRGAVEAAGGRWLHSFRCYGGERDGVNLLFSVAH